MALTPIALIPQVVLGGLMVPMTTNPSLKWVMAVMPARWGFQGVIAQERMAIAVDPALAEAHLQFGNLNSDQGKFAEAIPEYQRVLELDADLADAHYRLGQAYVRTGQKDRAQEQIQVYQQLRERHLADLDKQRAEIRQFVYSSKDAAAAKQ